MATLNSINIKTMKYFRASFEKRYKSSGLLQQHFAARLGISHTLVNRLLSGKAAVSFAQAEIISNGLGIELTDMLVEGRQILNKKQSALAPEIKEKTADKIIDGLNQSQIAAMEAFKIALICGGEAAEMLAKNAIDLAEKKRAEAASPTETHKHLKSA